MRLLRIASDCSDLCPKAGGPRAPTSILAELVAVLAANKHLCKEDDVPQLDGSRYSPGDDDSSIWRTKPADATSDDEPEPLAALLEQVRWLLMASDAF